MTKEEVKTRLAEICAGIVQQNHELMDEMDKPDFDPAIQLDNTKNNAAYKLTDFFDILKAFPYGGVPTQATDVLITTTDELLTKLRGKYGSSREVLGEIVRAGQAFRNSKRIWRIRNPIKSISQGEYEQLLDEACWNILRALDDLNYELNLLTIRSSPPAAKPPRKKCRGKGPQTDFKNQQREIFIKFLERRPITASVSKITRAHQCWLEHLTEWKLAAENHTGYANYKNLARAI